MNQLPDIRYMELPEAVIAYSITGKGPPLLLLHGFPETHVAWFQIAPLLEDGFTLIMADLPGYGDSTITTHGGDERYTKRNMARQLVAFMENLGYQQFYLAGHDRGARVAFRLCLDFPHHVQKVVMLDIIPTADIAERLNFKLASSLGNWWLMGQPSPLPETLFETTHEFYLEHILNSWSGGKAFFGSLARSEYSRCFGNAASRRAIFAEYRMGNTLDLEDEQQSREKGEKVICPLLILWSSDGFVTGFGDPLIIWQNWCNNVAGKQLNGSHFFMEELPLEVSVLFKQFFMNEEPFNYS